MTEADKDITYYKSLGINTKVPGFKRYKAAGLLDDVDENFVAEVKQYWQKYYHKNVDPMLHIAFMNLTGQKDPRIAFSGVWTEIFPYFNDRNKKQIYHDKNLYDHLIPSHRSVESILKRAHGLYFDNQNNCLEESRALQEILSFKEDLIVKPSDTDNGKGIKKLKYRADALYLDGENLGLDLLEKRYGPNFSVQRVVEQHPVMAAPHPSSVNTLRMVTLRWKNEIRYLLTFARFGSDNGVQDNAGTGGLCIGVTDTGEFLNTSIDENCNTYTEHPTTGFSFKEMKSIPNFDYFKSYVKDLHKEILHQDLVSWDIVVGKDGLPVFLEANFMGATWLYQLAAQKSLFGDLTEEVLEHVYRERNNPKSPRWKKLKSGKPHPEVRRLNQRIKVLQHKNKELIKENSNLQRVEESVEALENEKKELEKKLNDVESQLETEKRELHKGKEIYRKKYNDIKRSRSWRITIPVRKISALVKRK